MSNLVQLPNSRLVREQAAAWLVSIEEGLTDGERAELKAWLEADPAHGQALTRMAEHWDAFDALSELSDILPLHRSDRRRGVFTLKVAAAAATVLALATASFLITRTRDSRPPDQLVTATAPDSHAPAVIDPTASSATRRFETAIGKQLSTTLADGSTVTLNTSTSLDVEYSAEERRIFLRKGEAIFTVAHDEARPFRVRAGDRVVQAVGTVFNVTRGARDDVRVTVSEGAVKVLDQGSAQPELVVSAGERAVLGGESAQVQRIESSRIEASQAWQHGMLIYEGETLDTVIADVSRYTNVRFSIADDSIRQKRVGGVFRTGDVDGLLLALRESFGIEPRHEGDVIVLTARR